MSTFQLTRRGLLLGGGSLIAATAFSGRAADLPVCTLTGEQEEGPYYVDDETLRRDITESQPGLPLTLSIRLVNSRRCTPIQNAAVDIWHCDAMGVYSGFTANNPDGPPGAGPGGPGGPPRGPGGWGRAAGSGPGGPPPRRNNIDATRFLRGVQMTDTLGWVEFSTLYPGWYSGRAIHIHMKVHIGGTAGEAKYAGGHVAHTGQLFFPEDITERVARMEPYAKRLTVHRTTQEEDHIFQDQHGVGGMLAMERISRKSESDGWRGVITLAVAPEATSVPTQGSGPGGPGRRGPRGG